jgi:hypothetical protein
MLLRYLRCRALAALVGVLAAVIWTCAGGAATASGTATSFSGQACALKAQVLNLDEIDLGCATLPSTGGAENSSLLSVSNLALPGGITVNNAEVFGGHTVGQGNESHAHSSVANVNVSFAGQNVGAEFLMSKASAKCGFQPTGTSELVGLTINNQSYVVGTQPNQQLVNAAGVTITANKQTSTADTIDVAALEIAVQGVGTVDIATTHADIHCPSPPGPPSCPVGRDFITGGGWFMKLATGATANFGVAGGNKDGAFWGHLNYIDHGNGLHVKSTAVTGYEVDPNDPDCRFINYNVTIDGQPGTARVHVCDKGEPGRDDIFEIWLSTGYFSGGDLGGSRPGGGNIQLHKCE